MPKELWDEKAKERSKRRLKYFTEYQKKRNKGKYKSVGYLGEIEAEKILVGSKRLSRKDRIDFSWNGRLVEVKTAIIKVSRNAWSFYLRQKGVANDFLFICKDKKLKTRHKFLIPDSEIKTKHMWVSENTISKYAKYRV